MKLQQNRQPAVDVVVTEKIAKPTIINSIQFFPVESEDGEGLLLNYTANVEVGSNPCHAEGVDITISTKETGEKVLLNAYKNFDLIKNQFRCIVEGYDPINKDISGVIKIDLENYRELKILSRWAKQFNRFR